MEIRIARLALGVSIVFAFAFFSSTITASAALDFPSVADLEPGDLIKTASSSTVYYFGDDEQRYGFPNEKTYFTWYDDFDDVETISVSEMAMIPLADMVTYKPQLGDDLSTRLIKTIWDDTVYVPIGSGMLAAIKDGDAAEELFGVNWTLFVDDLPDAFASHYTFLGGVLSDTASFTEDDWYSISDDKDLEPTTGVMIYSDPLRFAASDETVDCDYSYCYYSDTTVESGNTLKFVNYAGETLTVRASDNSWTTGKMDSEDIVVVLIDESPQSASYYLDQEPDVWARLEIE